MPSSAELPPDIAPVSEIEACELRNKQWDYDLKSLFGAVWRTAPDSWLKRSLWWLRGRPALVGVGAALVAVAAVAGAIATGGGSGGSHERVCANQVIPPDVRDRLSVAQQTKDPAVEGTVFYGACQGQDWAIAEFPNNEDGVFKETGLSWTRLGSIEAAKCRVPDELLAAWKQGGC